MSQTSSIKVPFLLTIVFGLIALITVVPTGIVGFASLFQRPPPIFVFVLSAVFILVLILITRFHRGLVALWASLTLRAHLGAFFFAIFLGYFFRYGQGLLPSGHWIFRFIILVLVGGGGVAVGGAIADRIAKIKCFFPECDGRCELTTTDPVTLVCAKCQVHHVANIHITGRR